MPGTLILLESPNKVQHVKKYAAHAGLEAEVMATAGHILDLPPMKEGAYVDLETFEPTRLEPKDSQAADRLERLKAAMAKAETVIVATDPDREGEAIAAEVWPFIPKGKGRRATFEEITETGVKRGLDAMTGDLNWGLVEAATTRRVIDRLAGWYTTNTVFQKLRNHKGLSAGRVQSPALRLVVERFRDWKAFQSKSSFSVRVKLRTAGGTELSARVMDTDGPRTFATKPEAEAFVLGAKSATVRSVEGKEKTQKPKPPFKGSTWLQVAQKALGMPVAKATDAIQHLFEDGKTTYPRTDSVRVSEEAISWARKYIAEKWGAEFVPEKPWDHKDPAGVQGAHEAIRPTKPALQVEGDWAAAFGLIESRFLASQAAARRVKETVITFDADGTQLQTKGEQELFPGWKRVLATDAEEEAEQQEGGKKPAADEDEDEGALPPLAEGEALEVLGLEVVEHKTKPKGLFTQAGLIAELERRGIGRPSTFKACVSLILSRQWVTESAPPAPEGKKGRKKKAEDSLQVMIPEPVGLDLCDFLTSNFTALVDYGFTSSLEKSFDAIEAGKRTRVEVAREWWEAYQRDHSKAEAAPVQFAERPALGPCPACAAKGISAQLRLFKGTTKGENPRPYEFAGCERPREECGYNQPTKDGKLVAVIPCPKCQKPLKPITKKDESHALRCEPCDSWIMADKDFNPVKAPKCSKCGKEMVHRSKTGKPGEFFWACFEHKEFHGSDKFGKVIKEDASKKPKKA
jgi:DNA topoisomerase-1